MLKATWRKVWRVLPEGTAMVEAEASVSKDGGKVTVRETTGYTHRYQAFWFELLFGATPEQAMDKFLARQQQRLARARQDIAEIEQQIACAHELRRTTAEEAVH